MRPITAPGPVSRLRDHVGANGVEVDVAADFQQIRIAVHQDGLEAALKKMAHLAMAPVVRLSVDAIDVPHQHGQVRPSRVQNQVVMVAHKAIGQCTGIEAVQCGADDLQKRLPVRVIIEYRLTPVTPRSDVVDRAREFDA